ncbi:MAG: hypothetical protein IAE98_06040 [Candidatus Kapabacteria bacterium]|nr:hypothetical protein [Candidatus Kapabacteria bacterium]
MNEEQNFGNVNDDFWLDESERATLMLVVTDLLKQKEHLESRLFDNQDFATANRIRQIVTAIEYKIAYYNTTFFNYMKGLDFDEFALAKIFEIAEVILKLKNDASKA